eukprot:499608-Pyramimonas_sp.AAC.2
MSAPEQSVAQKLIIAIRSRVQFINEQAAAGVPREQLMQLQSDAIRAAITQAPRLTVDESTMIMGELNVGPWSADHKLALATILSDKVSEPVDGSSSRPQQYCDNLNRFFTEDDWAVLSNP